MVAQSRRDAQLHGHAPGVVLEFLVQGQLEAPDPAVIDGLIPVLIGARHDLSHLPGVDDLRDEGLVQHHADVLLQVQKFLALIVRPQDGDGPAVPLQGVHDETDGGAFTGPVFADQTQDTAVGQVKIQIVQRKALIVLAETADLDRVAFHIVYSSSLNT